MPQNEQHNTSEYWLGYSVTIGYKELYLYDHRTADVNWAGAVTIEIDKIIRANVAKFDIPAIPGVCLSIPRPGSSSAKHAIIHQGNDVDNNGQAQPAIIIKHADGNHIYTTTDEELIVLRVSTQPEVSGREHRCIPIPPASANIVELFMKNGNSYRIEPHNGWLDQFLKLSFENAMKLAECTSRSEVSSKLPDFDESEYSKFLDIILPVSPEAALALRLLCEAWEFTNPDEQKDFGDENGNAVLTIHSPGTEPKNWFDPFDLGDPGPDTAKKIAVLMGDQPKQEAAEKLLATISGFAPDETEEQRNGKLKVENDPDNLVVKTRKALTP